MIERPVWMARCLWQLPLLCLWCDRACGEEQKVWSVVEYELDMTVRTVLPKRRIKT